MLMLAITSIGPDIESVVVHKDSVVITQRQGGSSTMACHHRGHAPPTVVVASSATTRSSADGVAREPRGRHLARQRGPESGGRRTDITGLHPPHRLRAVNR